MLLAIQYPFADLRRFLESTAHLARPGWPFPSTDTEFVRYFGSIRKRRRGGAPGWVGESEVCEITRGINFRRSLRIVDPRAGKRLRLRIAFRRLYFDGRAVGKFEVGLATRRTDALDFDKKSARALIDSFLSLPIEVREVSGQRRQTELAHGSRSLVDLYVAASTVQNQYSEIAKQPRLVSCGTPLLFLETGFYDSVKLPFWMKQVTVDPLLFGVALSHCLVPYAGRTIPMWVMNFDDYSDSHRARQLRLYLLRLHAEHESLRLVLRHIIDGTLKVRPWSEASDRLQDYLAKATSRIRRLESRSSREFDADIADIARQCMDSISPGQCEALLDEMASFDMRRNVLNNVKGYADQWREASEGRYPHFQMFVSHMEGDIVQDKKMNHAEYNISGNIQPQIGAIGEGARGNVFGSTSINSGAAQRVNVRDLRDALNELYESLGGAGLSQETKRRSQTAVGNALDAGIEGDEVRPESLVTHVKQVGATLKEANVVIEEGTSLWENAMKVASIVGPIVGGATQVLQWFPGL